VDVLRLPWRAPFAFTVPAGAAVGLYVPDLRFLGVEDAFIRDELTRRYARLALGDEAVAAGVRAPSDTVLDLTVAGPLAGRLLLVSENWDTSWRAEVGGIRLPVRRAGPNLLAVVLDGVPSSDDGAVRIRLRHETPRAWWLGGFTTVLAMALGAVLARWGPLPGIDRERAGASGESPLE
jgi:hypothetical protein